MSELRLIPVPASDIRHVWPRVRAGLESTIAKVGSRGIPEDIFVDLMKGESFLYLVTGGGFGIFQQRKDVDGMVLHIFAFWMPDFWRVKDDVLAAIDQLARDCGALRVTTAGRKGWGRAGFKEVSRNFERELVNRS